MKLRFTTRATENLVEIAVYLHEHNPAAARRVRAAIYDGLQTSFYFLRPADCKRLKECANW
jgi:plasmid stabilization system protein ParE